MKITFSFKSRFNISQPLLILFHREIFWYVLDKKKEGILGKRWVRKNWNYLMSARTWDRSGSGFFKYTYILYSLYPSQFVVDISLIKSLFWYFPTCSLTHLFPQTCIFLVATLHFIEYFIYLSSSKYSGSGSGFYHDL